jgi:hypothetical protein
MFHPVASRPVAALPEWAYMIEATEKQARFRLFALRNISREAIAGLPSRD